MSINEKATGQTAANNVNSQEVEDTKNTLLNEVAKELRTGNLFTIKTASQWLVEASQKEVPQPLFNSFWNEGELCILFADTNLGKSILATQIGKDIAEKERVIYLDFELSDKQFEQRYSDNFTNHFPFPLNFLRAEINPDNGDFEEAGFSTFEAYLFNSIESIIKETGAKVLIVDNITYLRNETEKAKEAVPLMKHLNRIKKTYGVSILALAHTPKRDNTRPITKDHLQGSKMLMNFCDSSFAIGESTKDPSYRYLKQIKYRAGAFTYTTENVAVYEIKKELNFLMFDPVRGVHTSSEHEHLKQRSQDDYEELKNKAKQLNSQGLSQGEIALKLSISKSTVNKYINI